MHNWSGHHEYIAANVHEPATLAEVRSLAARLGKVKALGTRHSFNEIADTPGDQISLKKLDRIVAIDSEGEKFYRHC